MRGFHCIVSHIASQLATHEKIDNLLIDHGLCDINLPVGVRETQSIDVIPVSSVINIGSNARGDVL